MNSKWFSLATTSILGQAPRILLFTFSLFSPSVLVAVAPNADWDRLFNGEVIVADKENEAGIPGLQAMFVVSASAERIWEVLVDYEHFKKIFKGILKLRVLDENPSGAIVEFWIDAVLAELHYILYRHYERPGQRITWKRLAGDLKAIEGSWEISATPRSDQKLLVYESFVRVGGPVPTKLIRWGAKRRARDMGKRLRQWIEGGLRE